MGDMDETETTSHPTGGVMLKQVVKELRIRRIVTEHGNFIKYEIEGYNPDNEDWFNLEVTEKQMKDFLHHVDTYVNY